MRSIDGPVLAMMGAVALVACGDDDGGGSSAGGGGGAGGEGGDGVSLAQTLIEPGPYPVGFRRLELAYDAVTSEEPRAIPLTVWYPAVDGGEGEAVYAVAGLVSVDARGTLDAPAVAEGGPFPVAVYSHGSGGENLLGYPYGEHFASHGWIVIAPNHVGNTAVDGALGAFDPFPAIALNRPADISAALDFLEALGGDPLAGQARTDEVFVIGHSFGAYTTLAAGGADVDAGALASSCAGEGCELFDDPDYASAFAQGFGDPRVVAIAPQAPALVPQLQEGELEGLSVPTLLMSGRRDQTTSHEGQAVPAAMEVATH